MRKRSTLFFNAAIVRSRWHARRVNNLPGIFFYLNEFSAATATGVGFCCHWRQKCWPFRAQDHIFHLILVCSDEREAVFSPPNGWKGWCTPLPPRRRFTGWGLMPGRRFMNGFLPGAHGAPRWSGSPAACLPATSDECCAENTSVDSDHLCLSSVLPVCLCVALTSAGAADDTAVVAYLNRLSRGSIFSLWPGWLSWTEHLQRHLQPTWLSQASYLRMKQAVQFHHLNKFNGI